MAVAVTLAGAFFLISTADADARSRKRQRTPGAWQAGFSAIVVDAKTGKILDDESPDALRHPASLTKIMTLYVLFERIEQGKVSLKTRLNVSEYASERPPSKLGLQPGTTIAVEDAIKALVTRSANDVATVIAENLEDEEEQFAALMTKKARALGMSNTIFKNASGLPDREMVTTARDMATLGRAIQDRFPSLYRYFSTQSFVWRGRVIANHNRLLGRVPGVDGIKTGYTNASGFNLVTSVRHKNRYIVAVVLGGRTGAARDQYMRELIADNLDDATSGPRTTPMIAEAPAPQPKRVAHAPAKNAPQAQSPKEQKQQVARAPQPKKPQPVVVAGSNQPIRPIPVKTMPLDAEGKIRQETETVQAGVFAYSNLSASNVAAVEIVRNAGQKPVIVAEQKPLAAEQKPVVIADLPLQAQYQVAPVVGALAFSDNKPHPLAESPRLQPQVQAQKPANELSETEELEIEAQALASAKEDNLVPVPSAQKKSPKGPQVASTNSIPVSAPVVTPSANDDDGDPVPAAAKTGWSIQIGAFPNAKAARERLSNVKESATALLAKATPYTERVSKDSNNLFRARFAGFRSEWHARRVCQTLQQRDVDCIVAKN